MARTNVEWRLLALEASEVLQELTYARNEHARQKALDKARKFLLKNNLINTEIG